MSSPHDELRRLAPGYVLGSLDADEKDAFEPHVRECAECAEEVASLVGVVAALAESVPQQVPPGDLRQRVLSAAREASGVGAARPPGRAANPWAERRLWLPLSVLVILALGAGVYGSHLHVATRLAALTAKAEAMDREILAARRAAVDAQSASAIIAAPDLVRIDLKGQGASAGATARVLWSRQHGLAFAGAHLPPPRSGQHYEVWVVTGGAARKAGVLREYSGGLAVFESARDIPAPVRVFVTVEAADAPHVPAGEPVLDGVVGNAS